jgi:hypothetical protein
MICRHANLTRHAFVFLRMTGLRVTEFDALLVDMLPRVVDARQQRLARPNRQRAIGSGRQDTLTETDQILMTVVWLRCYPTNEVLGFLFGVSDSTASRVLARILPLLETAGLDSMRLPDPGRKHRKELDTLLSDLPELAVIIDTFEQRVQRPRTRTAADPYYSGKKKTHTLKGQVTVTARDGTVVDLPPSVPGPTADLTVLRQSGLMARLPPGVGAMGDLAYVGIAALHPQGLGATPRRKPRSKERPPADVAFNHAFARRRITVEHTIGRMRRYQCLSQTDRHHRRNHTPRMRAVAGLVNRQICSRFPR